MNPSSRSVQAKKGAFTQVLKSSLTIHGVDRSLSPGSWQSAFLLALSLGVVITLVDILLIAKTSTSALSLLANGPGLALISLSVLFYTLSIFLAGWAASSFACYLAGMGHVPLDTHVFISTMSYLPLIIMLIGISPAALSFLIFIAFVMIISFYLQQCYSHVQLEDQRSSFFFNIFCHLYSFGVVIGFNSFRFLSVALPGNKIKS